MISLFLDSSSSILKIALVKDAKLLFLSREEVPQNHGKMLLNTINKAFKQSSLTVSDVNRIIVVNGPGSFTGVRLGITVAKTLAWSLKVPIYSISSLEFIKIANSFALDKNILWLIKERENYFYTGIQEKDQPIAVEKYLSIEDINSYLQKTTDTQIFINKKISFPQDKNINYYEDTWNELMLNNVLNFIETKDPINPHLLKPIYIKLLDVEK